jgi:hypothetical protein
MADVTLPNGKVIGGVPEGTTKEQIRQKAIAAGLATDADFPMSVNRQQFEAGQAARENPTQTYQQAFRRELPPGVDTALKAGMALGQGVTIGLSDEIGGAGVAAYEKLRGNPAPYNQIREDSTNINRQVLREFAQENPVASVAAEIAGSMGTTAAIKAPAWVARLGPAARAAVTSGAAGAAMGAGKAEGGLAERAQGAVEVGIPSAIIGVGAQQALRLTGATGRRIAEAFRRTETRPTLEGLNMAKNVAYQAVDDSGLKFGKDQMMNLFMLSDDVAKEYNYVPEVDLQVKAALRMLEQNAEKELSIGQLDKLRQGLWTRYNDSGGKPAIREMIEGIDDMIAAIPETNDLMRAARAANSRFKKAELLDEAFKKAEIQTASTGSGGNILNKYRQAVTSILTNPKQSKWFSEPELEHMNSFVRGNFSENLLRRVGKLSPGGNGLMMALNIGAIAADPSMVGVTALGAAAKAVSDRSARTAAQELVDIAGGATPRRPVGYIPNLGGAVAVPAEQVSDRLLQNRR